MSDPPPRRRIRTTFRPRFTVMVFYVALFFFVFAMGFALPDLIEGARSLPASDQPLTDEELALASEITRKAVTGRLHWALAAAVIAVGVGGYTRSLPGLREKG